MGLSETYTDEVHAHLHPYYANWEPGEEIALGDYGEMDGDIFIYRGNLADLGLTFETRRDRTKDQKKFASEGTTETALSIGAGGNVGVVSAKAGLEIKFDSSDSVFFNAAECTTDSIKDIAKLATQLLKLYEQKIWKKKWAVVTHVVNAGATTVAVSSADNASITFEATGKAEQIDLADAKIGLKIASSSKVGYTVTTAEGMTPLFKLHQIQSTGFLGLGPDELQPALAAAPGKRAGGKQKKGEIVRGTVRLVLKDLA